MTGSELRPGLLEIDFGPRTVLVGSAGLRPLDDLDAMYRIASGIYGRRFIRPDRPWPLARPYIVGLRFGSPFEAAALVDLSTVMAGAGGLGLLGLIKLLWGFDIDLRNRRLSGQVQTEELRTQAAELQARRAAALADLADQTQRQRHAHGLPEVPGASGIRPTDDSPVAYEAGTRADPLRPAIEQAVSQLPEQYRDSARRRLQAIAQRPAVNPELARGELREPTPSEIKRLRPQASDRPELGSTLD